MIVIKASAWQYFIIYFKKFMKSKVFVKTFENNGKKSKNIGKLNWEQNTKSLLYNLLVYICAEEPDKTENSL